MGRQAHGSAGKAPLLRQGELGGEQCWLQTQRPLLLEVVILRGLPARETGPSERPLPRGRARFLSLIYGVVVYRVGPAQISGHSFKTMHFF